MNPHAQLALSLNQTDLGPDVEIDTHTAARLLGVAPRTVRSYCDEDFLREHVDWRRNKPTSPYFIKRRAVVEIKLGLR